MKSAERISPLLMLAFIRQESFFDPGAQSPANAHGLTQLLPGTATAVAGRIGAGTVTVQDLYRADLTEVLFVALGGDPPDHLDIDVWRPGEPVRRVRR